MSNKWLIALLVLLAGAYGATQLFELGTKKRNFRATLVEIDKDKVNKLTLYPQALGGKSLTFTKADSTWTMAEEAGTPVNIEASQVTSLLAALETIKPSRLAATDAEKWVTYEVTDDKGTRVTVEEAGKKSLDIYIGKFSVKQLKPQVGGQQNPMMGGQQQPDITSYVRLHGENQTYATNGLLSMTFNRKAEDFLPKPPPTPVDSSGVDSVGVGQ